MVQMMNFKVFEMTVDSQWCGSSSIPLASAVVPMGKALYPHCLVPWKGLKGIGPTGAYLHVIYILSGKVK